MTIDEAIKEAIEIEISRKQEYKKGTRVACRSNPKVLEIIEYKDQNQIAVCYDGTSNIEVPKEELFDVKQVINIGNHLLNLGFWREGMKSEIIYLA